MIMRENSKKLGLIYANCQRDLIKSHLELSSEFMANYELGNLPYHFKAIQTNFVIPEEMLAQTGLFIYQPIASKYGQQSTENIISRLPADCQNISLPYIYFKGYHPQFTKLKSDNLQQRFINDGSNLGDINIISLVKQGYSNEEIIKLISDENFYTSESLQQNLNNTLQQLSERELSTDIKIADFIRNHYQQNYLFYIPAHPANLIGYEVANQILSRLNFSLLKQPHPQEQLHGVTIPIYPSVAKHLNLRFVSDRNLYQPLSFLENKFNFRDCSQQYINSCRQISTQKTELLTGLSQSFVPVNKTEAKSF
jgi:hypothetical protein